MEARLIKTDQGNYILVDPTKGTYDKGYLLGSSIECDVAKLSLKNCQAIERGYDLDELAEDYAKIHHYPDSIAKGLIDKKTGEYFDEAYETIKIFKEGFQKALELMSDKRFTLKEMVDCWTKALEFRDGKHKETLGEHIQSLKEKEWKVEIMMEDVIGILHETHNTNPTLSFPKQPIVYGERPKLDTDGCLILKRI